MQPASTAISWRVVVLSTTGKIVVERHNGTEKLVYGEAIILDRGRPDLKASEKQLSDVLKEAGCPQDVIEQWKRARNAPNYLAAERAKFEADRAAAEQQQEREKHGVRFL
jgi:hypothetical protein